MERKEGDGEKLKATPAPDIAPALEQSLEQLTENEVELEWSYC